MSLLADAADTGHRSLDGSGMHVDESGGLEMI